MNETSAIATHKLPALKKIIFALLGFFIISIIAIYFYCYSASHPSTDDAYVQANTAQISAQVNGPVDRVFVENNELVKKNQLLFSIDPRPFEYDLAKAKSQLLLAQQQLQANIDAVAAARANLAQANAHYEVAFKNVPRTLTLVKEGQLSQATGVTEQGQLDVAKAAVITAQSQFQEALQNLGDPGANNANLLAAKANYDEAKLNLSYSKIYAPATGYLTNFTIRPGSMVTAAQPLFALIETSLWWIDANYKETDLAKIRDGQYAKVILDSYPNHVFKGVVQSISSGSGAAFSLLPPENATGNWVKVTQRFPVKVVILNPTQQFPLRVGASATVTINATT